MMDTTLRSRLAHSEAAAADLLAQSMRDDGNHKVSTETFSAGHLVSLGQQRYVNRLMCTKLNLQEDDIARTIDFFTSRNLPSSIQISSDADSGTSNLLRRHGFVVDWQRSVLAGRAAESLLPAAAAAFTVEAVHDDGLDDWLSVLARGNKATTPEARATSDEFGVRGGSMQDPELAGLTWPVHSWRLPLDQPDSNDLRAGLYQKR